MKRLFIRGAINEFNSQVKCVKFIARQANHIDHVQILKYDSCYSNLGRTGGVQVLSLDKGCLYKRSILGELLLTLGIGRENNRSDRDTHIEVLDADIPPQYQSQYVKQSPQDFRILGPYDYYSVTHLPQTYYFGNNKSPNFKVLQSNIDVSLIGHGNSLTSIDIAKANKLYGCA